MTHEGFMLYVQAEFGLDSASAVVGGTRNDENHGIFRNIYPTLWANPFTEHSEKSNMAGKTPFFNGKIITVTDFTDGYFPRCRSRSSMMSLIRTDVEVHPLTSVHIHPSH